MGNVILYGLIGNAKNYINDENELEELTRAYHENMDYALAFALSDKNVKASINMIIAGALYKLDDIEKDLLNDDTLELIDKLKKIEKEEDFLLSASDDVRVTIIKLVEKLMNIRIIKSSDVTEKMVEDIMKYYVVVADVLGMHDIKIELEDFCFKYLEPSIYSKIEEVINNNKNTEFTVFYKIQSEISKILKDFDVDTVRCRVKKPYGIYEKMCKNTYIGAIPDIYSVTIVLNDENEKEERETAYKCYSCLGYMHSSYIYKPNSFSDYIANPNYNRYKSLNSTILCDGTQVRIKICTKQMDEINRLGVMKDLYKKNKEEINDELNKYELYYNIKEIYNRIHTDFFDNIDFNEFYKQLIDLFQISEKMVDDNLKKDLFNNAKKLCLQLRKDAISNEILIDTTLKKMNKKII